MTTAKRRDNQDDFWEFQLWLQTVGRLAKKGNKEARDTLWRAFNSLSWPLAKLAQYDAASVEFDLLQDTLQHCRYMLGRGVETGNRHSLMYAHILAVDLCILLDRAEKHCSSFVADLKSKVPDWPMLKKTSIGRHVSRARSTQLAYMVFRDINVYRELLRRFKTGTRSHGGLSKLTEDDVRMFEANPFKKQVKLLPEHLDASTYRAWWEVGKEMLKSYWKNHPKERNDDLETLAPVAARAGQKTQLTYAIELVQKAFKTLAESLSK
jgi:hypothetical protein